MKKWRKRQNPYGVSRPMDRLALAMIFLATGALPKREEMEKLAAEAGIEPAVDCIAKETGDE